MEKPNTIVLIADDDPADRYILKKAFDEVGADHEMIFAKNGNEVLSYLKESKAQSRELPRMILLDLNMPNINGIETLEMIREDPGFKAIPVLILSNDETPEKIYASYKSGANSFIVKPLAYQQLLAFVATIEQYWFNIVSLPPGDNE